jgi:hypothetical protein
LRHERDIGLHIAYRQECLNAIEYLKKFGYSGAQAYSILGTAPNFLCMPSDRRKAHATNECSANAPKTVGEHKKKSDPVRYQKGADPCRHRLKPMSHAL